LADGTWTTAGAAYSNGFTGNAVANTTYYATATAGTCVSANSAGVLTNIAAPATTRCGTITATVPASAPLKITSGTTQLSGTLGNAVANTTVSLYEDGELVNQVVTATSTWALDVSEKLYAGNSSTIGILSLGISEAGTEEIKCPATYAVVSNCNAPTAPTVTPDNAQTVNTGSSITYTIQDPIAGVFYSLSDQNTGRELAPGVWATAATPISITTKPISAATTAVVKAVQMAPNGEVCLNVTSRAITVLPIILTEFKGKKEGAFHILSWKTTFEINSSHFEIEKSIDGFSFTKIGMVTTAGSAHAYSFTDYRINQINYYRLKLVDLDGQFKYSHVIQLKDDRTEILVKSIVPNPFYNEVKVMLQLPGAQQLKLILADAAGRQVWTKKVNGVKGENNIILSSLQNLLEGLYILHIEAGETYLQQKLIKVTN
jgi:hypothetical protein